MPTRTLEIDLRQGTGAESEPMYGIVTVQRAKAKTTGGFEILPFETSLKLINGKATITEAETDGTGPFYDSVYLFRVQNGYCAPRWGFMAALPDGTTPITTGELPMVDPITGEGIYMDAQEWNALYGDLPNRVSATESRLSQLDGLGQRGYTVDQTVGRTVKVWDYLNNREQLIYGDTGWRNVVADLINGVTASTALIRREGNTVSLRLSTMSVPANTYFYNLPSGFRSISTRFYWGAIEMLINSSGQIKPNPPLTIQSGAYFSEIQFYTDEPWPATLPGVAA